MSFHWRNSLTLLAVVAVACGSSACAFVAPVAQRATTTAAAKTTRGPVVVARMVGSTRTTASRRTSCTILQEAAALVDFVDPSYNLALGAFGVGLLGGFLEDIRDNNDRKLVTAKLFGALALAFTLFAGFLTIQTTTLRFTFDDTAFALVRPDGSSIGDNIKVGGENRWEYSKFVNWSFLPNEQVPLLVYFKETQTPVESRAEAPIVVDDLEGQAHFFPVISDAKQLKEGFLLHNCA